jgi:hypothetical protein
MLIIKDANPGFRLIFNLGAIFLIGFLGISIFYWVAARYNHPHHSVKYYLLNFPLFLMLSMGLSFQNTIAVSEGLFGIKTPFIRTPKFNIHSRNDSLKDRSYIETNISWQNIVEFILFLYFIFGVGLGIYKGDFGLLIFHLMLATGFGSVFYYSIKPNV